MTIVSTEPHWLPGKQYFSAVPASLSAWLYDTGSLTEQLIKASGGEFAVELLSQGWGSPRLSERRVLELRPRRRAVIREVILRGQQQPWVFARSILPVTSLTGPLGFLQKLDNRPLGALLFSHPGMRRGPIEIARIEPHHRLLPPTIQSKSAWGRRSVFYLYNKPLLVNEVFLDQFVDNPLGNRK